MKHLRIQKETHPGPHKQVEALTSLFCWLRIWTTELEQKGRKIGLMNKAILLATFLITFVPVSHSQNSVPATELRPEYSPNNPVSGLPHKFCNDLLAFSVDLADQYLWELDGPTFHEVSTPNESLHPGIVAGLQAGQIYNVRVKAHVNGVWGTYGVQRPAAISLPSNTQIIPSQCETTRALNQAVTAVNTCGASSYTFRFLHTSEPERIVVRPDNTCPLWLVSTPLTPGETYSVSAKVFQGGVDGDYSTSCNIAIANNNAVDCAGIPGGISTIDGCGVCNGSTNITLRSGNGNIGQADAHIRMLVGPADQGFLNVFSVENFINAATGSSAGIIANNSSWASVLSADNQAKWINDTGDQNTGSSCLYAIDFDIDHEINQAVINFSFILDDFLGGTLNQGIYLNGQPLSGNTTTTIGNFSTQTQISRNDIAPLLIQGTNTLYVYARDAGGPGGIIFSANISATTASELTCFDCAANKLYVDVNAVGLNNGSSWTDAYTDLQDALNSTCPEISEIWVADGTYLPGSGSDRNASFVMKDGLAIYGGFSGTETNLNQRNLTGAPSILSGDIGAVNNNADNSFTIVRATNVSNTAILDGFTLTAGNANGSVSLTDPDNNGAAMFLESASPLLRNLIFTQNVASDGGAIFSVNSNPVLTNCIFDRNTSGRYGGGFYALSGSNPQFTNCTFSGNTAVLGGGATGTTSSTTTLLNAIIWGNGSPFFNLAGTTNATFSIINGGHPGTGNIDADPLFIDAAAGNVNLDPCSPAINTATPTGAPATDILGNPRNVNGGVSMGAFEYQGASCCDIGPIAYVNASATGSNNGDSWTNAFTNLQDVLNNNCPSVSEIWVAAGTYYPDQGSGQTDNDRNATFQLKNGVAIYGGFAGTETMLEERDWIANTTTLSGDINQSGTLAANAFSVVTGSGTDATAVLDGFTITMGNSNGGSITPSSSGAGMYNHAGSPTVANSIFSGNFADDGGGGMYNNSSSPQITNCSFSGNSSNDGGGMCNFFSSSPTITNCSFSENTASSGGGMLNFNSSSPTVTNCSFSGNSATLGGGMFNFTNSSPTVLNSIIWNNSNVAGTTSASSSIYNSNSAPSFSYSLVANSGGSGSWDGDIGTDGGNNIDADPLYTDAANGNLTLLPGSPAIDAGDPGTNLNLFPGGPGAPVDLAGNPRVIDGTIDMGPYEFDVCPAGNNLYVDVNAPGLNNGSSWTHAFNNLQDALNSTCPDISEIWVAAGTYYPDLGTGQTEDDRNATFQMKNGVAIYGGFAGTETQLEQRDWEENETVLSGDIGVLDLSGDNAYHVLSAGIGISDALLDGFTVSGGHANGPDFITQQGAGLRIFGGASVDIANCRIENNYAQNRGGGIKVLSATANIRNTVIENNDADIGAGILANTNAVVNLDQCIVRNNTALTQGGGIFCNISSGELKNSLFYDNVAGSQGGAIMMTIVSTINIINSTIANNNAPSEGGIALSSSSGATIANSIFWNNNQQIGQNPFINASYSILEGAYSGTGIFSLNPLFTDPENGDFSLQQCSPAIDAGDNDAPGIADTLDLDGNPRIVDATEQGTPIVDMGAYEFQETIPDGSVFIDICGNCIGPDDTPCPPASIAGSVEGDINCLERDASVLFYVPGTANLVASYATTIDADGLFAIAEVEAGTFDIFVKVDQHLQKGFGSMEMISGPNPLAVGPLTIGDINDDNGINIDDLTLLMNAFGTTTGDVNFNPLADLNCDGGVNIDDLTNLLTNFGLSGDAAPF